MKKETARGGKRYTTAYKKKVDVERDGYLPRKSPKGLLACRRCGAIYFRRRWMLQPAWGMDAGRTPVDLTRATLCPGCRKVREAYPLGEIHLSGLTSGETREVIRLLRNEEAKAQVNNPLAKIIGIKSDGDGWKIETTTETLAQRLGRRVCKARGGSVVYKWSHNNKFVRVFWRREPIKKQLRAGARTEVG